MVIRIAEELAGPFGGSVRRDGLDIEVLFLERNPLVFSVNRRGRGKNEVVDSIGLASFQKDDRSADIHILIEERVGNGGSHPCPGRQMDNKFDLVFLEDPFQMIGISNIPCDELKEVRKFLCHRLHVLDFYVGIIKAIKIIDANDMGPVS
jgi:hypothetical protein